MTAPIMKSQSTKKVRAKNPNAMIEKITTFLFAIVITIMLIK